MIVLGIHDGHSASACLMVDGELIAMLEEDRVSRLKMDAGYPVHAIDFCLKEAGLTGKDVDHVAFASTTLHAFYIGLKMNALCTVDDIIEVNERYFKPLLYEGIDDKSFFTELRERDKFKSLNHYYDFTWVDETFDLVRDNAKTKQMRLQGLKRHLGISAEKVGFYDHHLCHATHAFFATAKRPDNTLVFTLDGGGDKSVSTVHQFKNGKFNELARTNGADIARIYRTITTLLGMRAGHHEYKVMGLAPYSNEYETKRSWAVFKNKLEVRDDVICYRPGCKPKDLYFTLRDELAGHRFDGIGSAIQLLTEEVCGEWILSTLAKYNTRNARFGGGVAMNVKFNMLMAEHTQIDDYFVPPSPNDNTLCIGACYAAVHASNGDIDKIRPIEDIYKGPSFYNTNIRRAIANTNAASRYRVVEDVGADNIADLLANNTVVARFAGKMEFGDRALGNRSILADPRQASVVAKINSQIKYRDFWMPFAPVILKERVTDYLDTEKPDTDRSFMTIGARATSLAQQHLPAALHAGDHTARPQVLERTQNSDYYDILKSFERRTGVGALINTSFNLHGEPIVLTPEHAISTMDRSSLDALILNDIALLRSTD